MNIDFSPIVEVAEYSGLPAAVVVVLGMFGVITAVFVGAAFVRDVYSLIRGMK